MGYTINDGGEDCIGEILLQLDMRNIAYVRGRFENPTLKRYQPIYDAIVVGKYHNDTQWSEVRHVIDLKRIQHDDNSVTINGKRYGFLRLVGQKYTDGKGFNYKLALYDTGEEESETIIVEDEDYVLGYKVTSKRELFVRHKRQNQPKVVFIAWANNFQYFDYKNEINDIITNVSKAKSKLERKIARHQQKISECQSIIDSIEKSS